MKQLKIRPKNKEKNSKNPHEHSVFGIIKMRNQINQK